MDQIVTQHTADQHPVVSKAEWVSRRTEFLQREKALTRLRDELSAARRELPWVRIEKDYVFEGPNGKQPLDDLFAGRSQLIIYHFMFGPDWQEGCKSCSFVADHFDGALAHLAARDVTLAVVSRAPFAEIHGFHARMGWKFDWFSSNGSDFSYDFGACFSKEDVASGQPVYNYGSEAPPIEDLHGASVFYMDSRTGDIFHTYSAFGRGVEHVMNTYNFLDMVPKGRDEQDYGFPMQWVRHHDKYEHVMKAGAACCGG
jgi:predicted dithiol-disulfide oxidoreductase (DUF899 family)